MKIWRHALPLMASGLLILIISCHTETPVNIDNQLPSAQIVMIYNTTDTLFNAEDSLLSFTDFQPSILEGTHYMKIMLSDNQKLYRVILGAEDHLTGDSYIIKTLNDPQEGEITLEFDYRDFPVVQEQNPQEFYLSASVSDESENKISTSKLGFKIVKVFPFNMFFDALGKIEEIEGDSVDFRSKNNKLAFIQFMSKGCLSCVEEAQEMKLMYADTLSYDLSKYSHSLFGNDTFTEAEFLSFKTRDQKLPFDCFWDGTGSVKEFFESLLGKQIENEVFAVLPNGKIITYDYLAGSFTDWIHSMYDLSYPN
ncbi:MAG: hypothetical protein A2Y39_01255 [Candidatus Delongbacteria bacterium GWF2_40_14]|nr:MAG: hypothetical protein A2Y39_01255 [Candidatus Delongbacteria bacterium GWF2_40_14]